MRNSLRVALPLAAAIPFVALGSLPAAHADSGTMYSAQLSQVNGSGGSGMLTLELNGNQAKISEHWSGLAAKFGDGPFPHVQHIHTGGMGVCPTPSADKNGDGVVDTPEGGKAYGAVSQTLSVKGDTSAAAATNIKIAPSGPSTDYNRTFKLNDQTAEAVRAGNAVIVVHGLDPSTLSKKAQKEKSPLVPSLPLAATAPALCGPLKLMPVSGPNTGEGSTSDGQGLGLYGLGAGLVAAGGAAFVLRRRSAQPVSNES